MRIPFEIFSVIAGIWAGFAFTFASHSIMHLDMTWPHWQRQSFVNRISLQNILLGCVLFAVGRLFGSGVVFGIDLIGVCSVENIIQGNILAILFIGANFGLFIGIWMWFDCNINSSRMIGYIVCLNIAVCGMFFGYTFSRLFSTPFIFTVVVMRLLSSILLYQFRASNNWNLMGKVLAISGICLLPLTAYGSSLRIVCPA